MDEKDFAIGGEQFAYGQDVSPTVDGLYSEFASFVRSDEANKDVSFRDFVMLKSNQEAARWYSLARVHGEAPEGEIGDLGNGDAAEMIANRTDAERDNAQEGKSNPTEDDVEYYKWLKQNTVKAPAETTPEPTPSPETLDTPEPTPPADTPGGDKPKEPKEPTDDKDPKEPVEPIVEEPKVQPSEKPFDWAEDTDNETRDELIAEEPEEEPSADEPTVTPVELAVDESSEADAITDEDDDTEPDTSSDELAEREAAKRQAWAASLARALEQEKARQAEDEAGPLTHRTPQPRPEPIIEEEVPSTPTEVILTDEAKKEVGDFLKGTQEILANPESTHYQRLLQDKIEDPNTKLVRDEIVAQLSAIFDTDVDDVLTQSQRMIRQRFNVAGSLVSFFPDREGELISTTGVERNIKLVIPGIGSFQVIEYEFSKTDEELSDNQPPDHRILQLRRLPKKLVTEPEPVQAALPTRQSKSV